MNLVNGITLVHQLFRIQRLKLTTQLQLIGSQMVFLVVKGFLAKV